jgi:hypothetical protein
VAHPVAQVVILPIPVISVVFIGGQGKGWENKLVLTNKKTNTAKEVKICFIKKILALLLIKDIINS